MAPQLRGTQPAPTQGGVEVKEETSERIIRSSPLVRRIAKEESVDLSQIEGTGLGGRITKKDILSHLSQKPLPEDFLRRPGEELRPFGRRITPGHLRTR